jgi:mannose-6-phosphate isomerase-like protein (cupin superfamily)
MGTSLHTYPLCAVAEARRSIRDEATSVRLGAVTVRYVHAEPASRYSLLEWVAPAGAPSPPVHVHHRTDEGFYVLTGTYAFLLEDARIEAPAGSHVLVRKGQPHTFWNAGEETARCLIVLTPPGFEAYFRELAHGLAASESDDAAMEVRRQLSARYDIRVVGPPAWPG